MINPMNLSGKKILVTGASSGIGREIAILLSKLGAEVVVVARNTERLHETIDLLEKGNHEMISFDLSKVESIHELMDLACKSQKLDGLVHAAGLGPIIPVQSMNYFKMLEVMNINYFAFMELAKLFSKRKYSNGGSIVAISSISSMVGWKGASIYCGSKGALDSSIRGLSIELINKNIRVNSVVPSNIKTQMFEVVSQYAKHSDIDLIISKQPLGIGESIDVANAVAFLLSDAAKFITGTALVVDGGYLAQ